MGWGGWLVLADVFTLLFGCGLAGVLCDVSGLTDAFGGGGLGCFTFWVLPMLWKEQVGLYYGSGRTHLIYVHRLCCAAEDKNVQTGYTSQPEGKSRMRRGRLVKLQSNKT